MGVKIQELDEDKKSVSGVDESLIDETTLDDSFVIKHKKKIFIALLIIILSFLIILIFKFTPIGSYTRSFFNHSDSITSIEIADTASEDKRVSSENKAGDTSSGNSAPVINDLDSPLLGSEGSFIENNVGDSSDKATNNHEFDYIKTNNRLDSLESSLTSLSQSLIKLTGELELIKTKSNNLEGYVVGVSASQRNIESTLRDVEIQNAKISKSNELKTNRNISDIRNIKDKLTGVNSLVIEIDSQQDLFQSLVNEKINNQKNKMLNVSSQIEDIKLALRDKTTAALTDLNYSKNHTRYNISNEESKSKIIKGYHLSSKTRKGYEIIDDAGNLFQIQLGKDFGQTYGLVEDYIINDGDFTNSYLITTTNYRFTTEKSKL